MGGAVASRCQEGSGGVAGKGDELVQRFTTLTLGDAKAFTESSDALHFGFAHMTLKVSSPPGGPSGTVTSFTASQLGHISV